MDPNRKLLLLDAFVLVVIGALVVGEVGRFAHSGWHVSVLAALWLAVSVVVWLVVACQMVVRYQLTR